MTDTDNTVPEMADNVTAPDTESEAAEPQPSEAAHRVVSDAEEPDENADTFSRTYVEKLRRESAGYRERAAKGDAYAQRLHAELVRATGKLADPTDLAFDEEHLDDPDQLAAAIDDLLARKPHLASRRPTGEIGQGATPSGGTVDLAAILRQRAR